MKLVLFDIDGTLLLTDGAGKRAIQRALHEVFGHRGADDHRFDGKTDPQIVRELMRLAGQEDGHIDAQMAAVFRRYVECLHEELAEPDYHPYVLPGVPSVLDAVERHGNAVLGLLTGNLADGARAKLRAVGIDPDRFAVGAFGSDHELRSQLPAIAQRRTREVLGLEVAGSDVVILGDTPSDIECGRGIGARAIGVATGRFSVEELQNYHPAAAFEDLSNTDQVLAAIFG